MRPQAVIGNYLPGRTLPSAHSRTAAIGIAVRSPRRGEPQVGEAAGVTAFAAPAADVSKQLGFSQGQRRES